MDTLSLETQADPETAIWEASVTKTGDFSHLSHISDSSLVLGNGEVCERAPHPCLKKAGLSTSIFNNDSSILSFPQMPRFWECTDL